MKRIMKAGIPLMAAFLVSGTIRVQAATIPVTNTADSGSGTLREALANAADGDTITFSVTTPATIALISGELLVTNSLTILGPGPNNLAVDGNGASRVFHVMFGSTSSISGLTITNGYSDGGGILNDHSTVAVSNCAFIGNSGFSFGGGIYNNGDFGGSATLIVNACTFSRNSAYSGGAIFNEGFNGGATLTLIGSVFSNNSAGSAGGGIYNGYATETVLACTFTGNSANFGGGIFNFNNSALALADCTLNDNMATYGGGGISNDGFNGNNAILNIVASTISGNTSGSSGGGIDNTGRYGGSATLVVSGCTFSGNSADFGGGIFNNGANDGNATVEIGNTILETGASGGNIVNFGSSPTSHGYNLSSDDGGGFLTATGDQINTDPMLGPLQDNGGPTFTHALLCDSPAIDQGRNLTTSVTDQRGVGFARTFDNPAVANATGGDGTDIGAFEVQQGACDSDGDGVPDDIDQCPNTPSGSIVNAHGCSIAQLVPCDGPSSGGKWKSHGQYVQAIVKAATDFLKAKLITRRQWTEIVTRAAWSKCGWNRRCDHDWDGDWHRNWDCDRDRDWGRYRNWDRD